MEQNHDPHQIVISREYFDKLVHAAEASGIMEPSSVHPNRTLASAVRWHVRKFNPAYKQEQHINRLTKEQKHQANKAHALAVAKRFRGQLIAAEPMGWNRLLPLIVIGVHQHAKDKLLVKFPKAERGHVLVIPARTPIFYEIKRINTIPEQDSL